MLLRSWVREKVVEQERVGACAGVAGGLAALSWTCLAEVPPGISSPQCFSSERSLQSAVVSHRGLGFFTQVPSSQR